MPFSYEYTVQFRDTDAAGVVYFASILSICHVAYEASLIHAGIDLKLFVTNPEFAVPITHVSADFFRPLFCGDRITIELTPKSIDNYKFEIEYQIRSRSGSTGASIENQLTTELLHATALSKHIVIDPSIRKRKELPDVLTNWLNLFVHNNIY
jgi:1,4-dihydroxy-2-naphthoyl-CoA hydrolase